MSNDPDRRLRQHNGEIKGGARYTVSRSGHHKWTRVCCVGGFPDKIAALQFEWKWKRLTRSFTGPNALYKRMAALSELLKLEKPTKKSVPFDQYSSVATFGHKPTINWENSQAKFIYRKLNPVKIRLTYKSFAN